MAKGYAESKKTDKSRLAHGRAFCAEVIEAYWEEVAQRHRTTMKVKPRPEGLPRLTEDVRRVAHSIGGLIAQFPVEDAGYLVGSIYTVTLPSELRSELGAFYTPPPLVARLLDLAEEAGFDFTYGRVIDPACGGGAFLAPVALRMVDRAKGASADWLLKSLGKRLRGIEIDPFAAWMTRVLLEAAIMPLCVKAKRRLADVVVVADALEPQDIGEFDLVIGNPPYGRISLPEPLRKRYARSLFGHANLYGLFTDLALRLTKSGGVVAYLTPTSFLGGQYFKALRTLLTQEAAPVAFDFVADRNGVFDNVLQETLLTTYVKKEKITPVTVSVLVPQGLNTARIEHIGKVKIDVSGAPWILPRNASDADFLQSLSKMSTRLSDLGYSVSTGPLVWNRHKDQLMHKATAKSLPLVWAESVTSQGFKYSAERRNHLPYVEVRERQQHLITNRSCVLVQRTTSKEQSRRLMAALLPQEFLNKHRGVVVENHLNMVTPQAGASLQVSPATVTALLNSEVVDRAFRCISGSVAVSAYELNAIPMPSFRDLRRIDLMVNNKAPADMIEREIALCYGVR
ncbi:Eco57I restriction-modification methylase domain-containing protein [Pseudoxanthomonas sp. PXM05]|nr:Eco57I restriction-modification methylase domain-containing protein [Pseudoxanthomonas sp. PXM05]